MVEKTGTGLGTKILAGIAILGVAFLGAFAGASALKSKQEVVDFDKLVADAVAAQSVQNSESQANLSSDVAQVKADVIVLSDKLLEEDLFEASVEALAQEDLKYKNYRELFNHLSVTYADIFEKEDITEVVIRDIDVSGVDVDNGDATVVFDLKVKYENVNGTSVKKYITATSVIIDNEVDSLTFV